MGVLNSLAQPKSALYYREGKAREQKKMMKFRRPSSAPGRLRGRSNERNRKALRAEWERFVQENHEKIRSGSGSEKPPRPRSTNRHRTSIDIKLCRNDLLKYNTKNTETTVDANNNNEIVNNNNLAVNNNNSELCVLCGKGVGKHDKCTVCGETYHQSCLNCVKCRKKLISDHFRRATPTELYCNECFVFHKTSHCVKCKSPLIGLALEVDGELFHPDCFRCQYCECVLSYSKYYRNDDAHSCEPCYARYMLPDCHACKEKIRPENNTNSISQIVIDGKSFHTGCFACSVCAIELTDHAAGGCFVANSKYFCKTCIKTQRVFIQRSQL